MDHFAFLPATHENCSCSTTLLAFGIINILYFGHSGGYGVVVSHCGFNFFNFIFIVDTIADVPLSPPLCPPLPSSHPPFPSGHHHTVVCVYGLCIYDL